MVGQTDYKIDQLDASLLEALQSDARVGVLELSRRLGVARGTVQARIDRMIDAGIYSRLHRESEFGGARLPGEGLRYRRGQRGAN